MWIATKQIAAPNFTVQPGMPVPHQHHAGFLRRLRELYGEDCLRWVQNVTPDQLRKTQLEIERLSRENKKLREQNAVLQGKLNSCLK